MVGILADECERLVNILYYAAGERLVIIKNELICFKKKNLKRWNVKGIWSGRGVKWESWRRWEEKTTEYTITYLKIECAVDI